MFHSDLTKNASLFFVPIHGGTHPVLLCLLQAIRSSNNPTQWTNDDRAFIQMFNNKPFHCREGCRDILKCMTYFQDQGRPHNVSIYTLVVENSHQYIRRSEDLFTTPKAPKTIHLLTTQCNWGLMYEKKGKLPFMKRWFCNTCARWITKFDSKAKFMSEHFHKCCRCHCGKSYPEDDIHFIHCKKLESFLEKHRREKLEIQKTKQDPRWNEQNPNSLVFMNHMHFADFETLCKGFNDKFVCYSVSLVRDVDPDSKTWVNTGKDSLTKFMAVILDMQGILWFFNGSRFDCYFILEYCEEYDIEIDHENSIIADNKIIVLAIQTKRGMLVIKDLAMFLHGSLANNCKTYGIENSQTKGSFDHNSVKTWEDVTKLKSKIEEYNKLDVIALRAVYKATAGDIWRTHKIDMSNYVSLAQLSLAILMLKVPERTLYRIPLYRGEEKLPYEDNLREAYRGGRLILTIPIYKSRNFDEVKSLCARIYNNDQRELLEERVGTIMKVIDDDLVDVDACSLYPSVMYSEQYPCGKMTFRTVSSLASTKLIRKLVREATREQESLWKLETDDPIDPSGKVKQVFKYVRERNYTPKLRYRVYHVDITCPKDLYVPFVMDRNSEGASTQDLTNKTMFIYGAELLEAITLGYTVTKVYSYYHWAKTVRLFKDFVSWGIGVKFNAKDPASRQNAKNVLNGNSGKHGQLTRKTAIRIKTGANLNYEDLVPEKITTGVESHFQQICKRDGSIAAVITKENMEPKQTPGCLQLSVAILSESKVRISVFMRAINGYRNSANIPIYGDTDSIIFPRPASIGVDATQFGEHLGQMKDEMPRYPNNRNDPKKVIIAMQVVAPKTNMKYIMVCFPIKDSIDDNGEPLYTPWEPRIKFTSKGIPHPRELYDPRKDYTVSPSKFQEAMDIWDFLTNRTSTKDHYNQVVLGEPIFLKFLKGSSKVVEVKSHITWEDVTHSIDETHNIVCLYGGMIRNIKDTPKLDEMGICLDYQKRTLSVNSWWKKGNRTLGPNFPFDITKPNGFE